MSNAVSSAVPAELFRYAQTGEGISLQLSAEAERLHDALQRFAATCREPFIDARGITVDSLLAGALRDYARQASAVDEDVREVGRAFQAADAGSVAPIEAYLVVPELLARPFDIGARLERGDPIADNVQWLIAQLRYPTWSAVWHQLKASHSLVERARSSRDTVREHVREWWRNADAWQQRMWEKFKSFESPLLKYLPEGVQDFLCSARRAVVSVFEWQLKKSINVIWGFVWGEPLFEEAWGADFFAFAGDLVGGFLIWSDIRGRSMLNGGRDTSGQ